MNCAICGSAEAAPYLSAGRHLLVRCRSCGLVRTAGFRRDESVYAPEKYFTVKDGYVDRWEEFRSHFESLVGKIVRCRKGGVLLDVGTGVGALMHAAAAGGFRVRGVETSEWAAAFARNEKGLDVTTGTLADARFAGASFDVVVVNHVLEHLDDPKAMLAEIRRVLKDDGLLVIGVPNAASLMARLLGGRWASWRPEQHVWHFDPATLSALVGLGGFDVVRWEARDNTAPCGWRPKETVHRIVNAISRWTNRSEAMLLFARKRVAGTP